MSLTPKQQTFADGILAGLNQTEAYKAAYDVSPDCLPSTVHNAAYALTQNPDIAASIEAARDTRRGWTLARVVAEGERNLTGSREAQQWASANGALAFLGKVTGTVTERPTAETVSITRVTIVLDSGVNLSLESNVAASLSEPSLEAGLEAGSEPSDTTASY
jgi:hypothetical protein